MFATAARPTLLIVLAGGVALSGIIGPGICEAADSSQLAIILDIRGKLAGGVEESMRAEAARILEIPDLEIAWRLLDGETHQETFERIVMVRLAGACTARPAGLRTAAAQPLGFTHISNGVILPFAEIDCDLLRCMIRGAAIPQHAKERERLLGRALGRVLAHEVYHIIARTTEHSRDGVASEAFRPSDLTCANFRLDGHCLGKLMAAVSAQAPN